MRAHLLLLALLTPLALSGAQAQSPTDFYVNVVSARSIGCSPDSFTQPDLRVHVYVNDAPLLTTEKAQDVREPLYAQLVRARATLPARITVEVQEAEPSGIFGTSWVDCDVAEGAATRYTYTYSGGASVSVRALGDGERAAEAVLVVGTSAPPEPVATASNVGTTSATVMWDDVAAATGHRLGGNSTGPSALAAAADVRGATLTELCDNEPYTLRVVRDADPWHVASLVSFRTANAAPTAPRVLSAPREDGNATIEWEAADLHDAARFEVLVGSGSEPTTVRATVTLTDPAFAKFSQTIALQPGDVNVRVRLVDEGNLSSTSPSFPINATPQDAGTPFARTCGFSASALPPAARTASASAAPTSSPTSGNDPLASTPTTAATASPVATTTTQPPPQASGSGARAEGPVASWLLLGLVALVGVLLGAVIVLLARR